MHDSVRRFGELMLPWSAVHDKRILEVGSLDVNGTLRGWCESQGCAEYIGTDMRDGPGVDLVVCAEDLLTADLGVFDVVISTEMLEHAEDWRSALAATKAMVIMDGLLLLTTRSPGFGRHEHPSDYWRFTKVQILVAMSTFHARALADDPDAPGVLYAGVREVGPERDTIPFWINPERAPGG